MFYVLQAWMSASTISAQQRQGGYSRIRHAATGHKPLGREAARETIWTTQEIQRLIGRSLRAVTDLKALGERQIKIDCDVIQADGGTRTAAITGSNVALHLALAKLAREETIKTMPLLDSVAAISCGIYKGEAVLDLDYAEDSDAETDANFVLTGKGKLIEIQATAEQDPFEEAQLIEMLSLAKEGIKALSQKQLVAIMSKNESA